MRHCRECGLEKSRSEFYRDGSRRDGLRSSCKTCELARKHAWYRANRERAIVAVQTWRQQNPERYAEAQHQHRLRRRSEQRADHLKRTFGLTLDEYDAMLARQDGRCAICDRVANSGRFLHVDHDHKTGEIRGLLCVRCNNALGLFRDDASTVERAGAYLASSGGSTTRARDIRDVIRARVRELVSTPG